jgi:hypothetical protein
MLALARSAEKSCDVKLDARFIIKYGGLTWIGETSGPPLKFTLDDRRVDTD